MLIQWNLPFIKSFWHWRELGPLYGDWVGHFCKNVVMRFSAYSWGTENKKKGMDLRCSIRIKMELGNQFNLGSRANDLDWREEDNTHGNR